MITVDPRTERDLALVASEYEKRGKHITPSALIDEILVALRDVLRAEQPSQRTGTLTDDERAILRQGGFNLEARDRSGPDAFQRTALKLAAIITDAYTTSEAADILGVTTGRVRQMLSTRDLYGIKWKNGWRIPRFQFDGDHLIPYVGRVLSQFDPELDLIAVFNWFTLPNDDLRDKTDREMSPREWLIAGRNWKPVAEQAAIVSW